MRSAAEIMDGKAASPARSAVLAGLRERITQLPRSPGVYLFQDATAAVLYVGKANCLRSRVASYFQPAADLAATRSPRIGRMIAQHVADIDFIVCDHERQALARESRLIREIQPRFNVAIKNRRRWAYVQITREDFPRVEVTSDPQITGTTVIGPFASMRMMREIEPMLHKSFGLRSCGDELSADRRRSERPCLRFEMGQCTGPCAGLVTLEAYREQVRGVKRMLTTRLARQKRDATEQMLAAVAARQFERAAQIRDMLAAADTLCQRPAESGPTPPAVLWARLAPLAADLAGALGVRGLGTIECVSALCEGGQWSAGMACFIDGLPHKSAYRRMRLAGASDAADAIALAIRRRHGGSCAGVPADLVLVDGGPAALAAAARAYAAVARRSPKLAAIADDAAALLPGDAAPISLPPRGAVRRLLRHMQRETRSLARSY